MDGPELTPATRKRSHAEPRPVELAPAAQGEETARIGALEASVRAIDVRIEYLERLVSSGFQEVASRSLVIAEATDAALGRIEAALSTEQPAPPVPLELGPLLDAVRAIEERIGALPTEPSPPVDLGPITGVLVTLQEQVTALSSAVPEPPPPADLGPLMGTLAAVQDRVMALPTNLPEPPVVDVEPLHGALRELGDRVESIEPRVDEIKRRVDDLAVAIVALQPTIDAIVDLRSHVELVGGRLSDLLGGPSLTELMDRLDEIADTTGNDRSRRRR